MGVDSRLMRKRILFRCDGGDRPEIGLGHIVRDLALAEELTKHRDINVHFVVRGSPEAAEQVRQRGFPLTPLRFDEDDLIPTQDSMAAFQPDIFVGDCLSYTPGLLKMVKAAGAVLITLDYHGADRALADLSINGLLPTGDGLYEGYDYIVLPNTVPAIADQNPIKKDVESVFVSFGGFDSADLTSMVIDAVGASEGGRQYDVVVSKVYAKFDNLRKSAAKYSNVRLYQDPSDYPQLLSRADMAIVAGGLTMFQAAAFGVPAIVVSQYPHQATNAERLAREGAVEHAGLAQEIDGDAVLRRVDRLANDALRRHEMARKGRLLLDGLGLQRVSQLIGLVDRLDWDSHFFGLNIATLHPRRVRDSIMRFALAKCAEERIDCLYYLCDCNDAESVKLAEANRFHFVDIRLEFEICLNKAPPWTAEPPTAGTEIRTARESDIPELAKIAEESYVHSRYYFDRRFPIELYRRFYRDWVAKSVRGQFEKVAFVATVDGRAAGYVTCGPKGLNRGRIGLVGISPLHQGRGLGKQLIARAFAWFREQNLPMVEVVTQGRNIPAQRLYQSCGFRTGRANLWYHKWLGDASSAVE